MQSVSEQAIRRRAATRGYLVRKSRSRNPDAPGYGGFMLVEASRNLAVLGTTHFAYSADLEEIGDFLTDDD